MCVVFFFFKQKTAYEMRISDWSSDVCSSDLNCVGVVKQLASAGRVLDAVPINALLPHRLARLCGIAGARLVHISTDCVFDGARGDYCEEDAPNALDLYGTSKRWGEVIDQPHAITLRTSIICHETGRAHV